MERQRKRYTPKEKVKILRRQLIEKVPVSDLCDEFGLQPTMFYRWQKEFFENGEAAFQKENKRTKDKQNEKITVLEEKLKRKNEVLSELMEEHVALKKSLGEI
jgi:transposase-like protein